MLKYYSGEEPKIGDTIVYFSDNTRRIFVGLKNNQIQYYLKFWNDRYCNKCKNENPSIYIGWEPAYYKLISRA